MPTELTARITVNLPDADKRRIEDAAHAARESVSAWLLALALLACKKSEKKLSRRATA